jgi:hypothetical protein
VCDCREARAEDRAGDDRVQQQAEEGRAREEDPNKSAKIRPISAPCPAPVSAALPMVTRPDTCSTERRPRPTIETRSTAKPWSESQSTARSASG